jgi:hypothetical protein
MDIIPITDIWIIGALQLIEKTTPETPAIMWRMLISVLFVMLFMMPMMFSLSLNSL